MSLYPAVLLDLFIEVLREVIRGVDITQDGH